MVVLHVEVGVVQHPANGGHVRRRPAAEDDTLRQVGCQQLQHLGAQEAAQSPHGSRGESRSHTGTTRMVGTVLAIVSSSRRKMMSDGVRALCTNTTSASEPRSYRVRVMDMTGVIPLPPDRKRYFADWWRAIVKTEGAVGRDALSGSHRVVQPVRHKASRLAFDGDTQEMGACRR